MPTVVGAGLAWAGLKEGLNQVFEPDNIFKEMVPAEINNLTSITRTSTLSQQNQQRIKEIYKTYGKDVRVLDLNPEYDSAMEQFSLPFAAPKNKVIVPTPSRIALEKGAVHKTYVTPEEVEAFVHIEAQKSSSFNDSMRCADIPAAFVARKIGLLKNKNYGTTGLVIGYLTSKFVTTLLLSSAEAKAHLLPTSQLAFAAASGYSKNGNYAMAEQLKKWAEVLRAQGK